MPRVLELAMRAPPTRPVGRPPTSRRRQRSVGAAAAAIVPKIDDAQPARIDVAVDPAVGATQAARLQRALYTPVARECSDANEMVLLARLVAKSGIATMPTTALARQVESVHRRADEEAFMRTPTGALERECAAGQACEAVHLPPVGTGAPLVEWIAPAKRGLPAPQAAGLCIICLRKHVAQAVWDVYFSGYEVPEGYALCDFQNMITTGEYALDDCIPICTTKYIGLHGPVLMHDREKYRVKRSPDGTSVCVQQSGYRAPTSAEDATRFFESAPAAASATPTLGR